MSSFPLPALQVHPVEAPDVLGGYERVLQLRNMLQNAPLQRQALQQQVQSGQLENQQKQQQIKNQQAITAAYQQWDGKNYDDLAHLALKSGASGDAVQGLQQHGLTLRDTASQIAERDATTGSKIAETMRQQNQQVAGALQGVLEAPPQQQPQMLLSTAQSLAQQKKADGTPMLDSRHLQLAQTLAQQGPQAIAQALPMFQKDLLALDQQLDAAQKNATIKKDNAQAGEATAQADKLNQQAQFGPAGDTAEAKYRSILQKKASGQPLSADDVNYARAFEASNAKTSTTSDTLGVTSSNTSRPTGLASMGAGNRAPASAAAPGATASAPGGGLQSPSGARESIVDMIGQYRYDPAQLGRLVAKHPDVLALVQQKYPEFDQTTYQAKNKLLQGYTSGQQSREINAINTAMGHVKVLDDAVDALNNGNLQLLNSIGNKLGVATGSTPQTTFQAIVHRVGPEITSAYVPGAGGEGERFANEKDFSTSLSPDQLHSNAAITVKLLRSKVGALENQYKNTVGRDDFNQRFITPEAQSAFQKFGGNSGNPGSVPPEGTVKTNGHGDKIVVKGGKWQLAQ